MNTIDATRQAEALDKAARHARLAQEAAGEAGALALRSPYDARERAATAKAEAGKVIAVLCGDLAATVPGVGKNGAPMQVGPLDLASLATFDSPEARAVLDMLTQAQEAAEKLDARRGHVLPAHIPTCENESRGTNYAEDISMLAARLRGEIFGAKPGRE